MNFTLEDIMQEGPESKQRQLMKKQREEGKLTMAKNKMDHINGLVKVSGGKTENIPEYLKGNKLIRGDINSTYRSSFMFGDEGKELIAEQTKEHNVKADEFKVYANEFIKFKGNLRLL